MKKNLTFLMLMISAMMAFTACSNDDDSNGGLGDKDEGSNNKTDVAVTGAVQEIGVQYVVLAGYVNLNMIPSMPSNYKMGIQIGRANDDYDPSSASWGGKEYVENLIGNKIVVSKKGLAPAQEWRYRTFVYADGHYYFGETKTFETKDFVNITSAVNVSVLTSSSAEIQCSVDMNRAPWLQENFDYYTKPMVGVAWAKDRESLTDKVLNDDEYIPYEYRYVYLNDVEDNTYSCTLYSLEPNTTYYYCSYTCIGENYRGGTIKSFTTK